MFEATSRRVSRRASSAASASVAGSGFVGPTDAWFASVGAGASFGRGGSGPGETAASTGAASARASGGGDGFPTHSGGPSATTVVAATAERGDRAISVSEKATVIGRGSDRASTAGAARAGPRSSTATPEARSAAAAMTRAAICALVVVGESG
jgi:hypothetical protein